MTALVWMSRSQYTLGAQKGVKQKVEARKEGGVPRLPPYPTVPDHINTGCPQVDRQGLTQWVGGELPAVYLQGMSPTFSVLGFLGYWGS